VRGYLAIVPVAARGSTGLYVRRGSGDPVGSLLSGSRVQGTGCGYIGAPPRPSLPWVGVIGGVRRLLGFGWGDRRRSNASAHYFHGPRSNGADVGEHDGAAGYGWHATFHRLCIRECPSWLGQLPGLECGVGWRCGTLRRALCMRALPNPRLQRTALRAAAEPPGR